MFRHVLKPGVRAKKHQGPAPSPSMLSEQVGKQRDCLGLYDQQKSVFPQKYCNNLESVKDSASGNLSCFTKDSRCKLLKEKYTEQFENFTKQFNKVYESPEEHQYRLSVFIENVKAARRLQEEELGTAIYGITKFSDLTDEEFKRNILTLFDDVPPNDIKELKVEATPMKRSCDWRKAGVISRAKNQGNCGSCWAFAAVANIEAQWAIVGHSANLSVQQVLDCSPCSDGCKGGYLWDAYKTVMKQRGLVSECVYPYKAIKQECKKMNSVRRNIKNFRFLPRNERVMASYVGNQGTIAVAMNAIVLKCYNGGVIRRQSCNRKKLNHAVLLTGFSRGTKLPYWIIKNSWGDDWGECGFFKLFFGVNMCGITSYPMSAVVPGSRKRRIRCPC